MAETKEKIEYLVADTTAFINTVHLNVSVNLLLFTSSNV